VNFIPRDYGLYIIAAYVVFYNISIICCYFGMFSAIYTTGDHEVPVIALVGIL
jgi:hypothetical protein